MKESSVIGLQSIFVVTHVCMFLNHVIVVDNTKLNLNIALNTFAAMKVLASNGLMEM